MPYGFSVEGCPEMGGRTEDAATPSDAPALRPRYARFGAALYAHLRRRYASVEEAGKHEGLTPPEAGTKPMGRRREPPVMGCGNPGSLQGGTSC